LAGLQPANMRRFGLAGKLRAPRVSKQRMRGSGGRIPDGIGRETIPAPRPHSRAAMRRRTRSAPGASLRMPRIGDRRGRDRSPL